MNRTATRFVSASLALALSIGCAIAVRAADAPTSPGATPIAADTAQLAAFKRAIRSKYDLKEKAWLARDAETVATRFYAADAVMTGQSAKVSVGRDQIRSELQKDVNGDKVKVTSVYTFVDGSAGWDWADFDVLAADGTIKDSAAMLVLWAKVDGQWMCKGEFWATGSLRAGKLGRPSTTPK